jgi:alpha-ketoglutarate-dependent taurine dioxygenase
LSSLLARPVAQKITGQMFYDVMDTGAKLRPGSGIRPTVTNVDLRFHNDNSYNETPPEYVCLLCLHPARQGGISQVMSVATVHQALQDRHPELMPRLYSRSGTTAMPSICRANPRPSRHRSSSAAPTARSRHGWR